MVSLSQLPQIRYKIFFWVVSDNVKRKSYKTFVFKNSSLKRNFINYKSDINIVTAGAVRGEEKGGKLLVAYIYINS